jgi:hypothetical protein
MRIESVTDNHPALARSELESCKGKNAVFFKTSLTVDGGKFNSMLARLNEQLDLVKSDFESVKHQQVLF